LDDEIEDLLALPSKPETAESARAQRDAQKARDDAFDDIFALPPEPGTAQVAKAPQITKTAPVVRAVLCVEVQDQIQQVFRKTLSGMGYRVVLAHNAREAAKLVRESLPDVVLYDADGLGSEALDDFLALHSTARKASHGLASLVLLGPRQRELADKLPANDRLIVLTKPVKMKEIQHAMTQLVPLS
jgi:CheY-like chemotaxis protein